MSMTTTTDLVRHLGARAERIVTVRPGRPVPQADDGHDGQVLARFGITKPFVLALGTLEPRKNLVLLLDVFGQTTFRPELQLVLAGPRGWKMGRLGAPIEALLTRGALKLPGYVSDSERSALYRRALCLAFPSLYEGFGLPLLEAMSYGCPVVASTAPACVEVVGDGGVLLPPNDAGAWTAAVERLARDQTERARLKTAGLARARLFSWSDSVQPLIERLAAAS
jgi:glycosyltransferase involved in cell wall biosynthesis